MRGMVASSHRTAWTSESRHCRGGREAFYRGRIAERIVEVLTERGGSMTMATRRSRISADTCERCSVAASDPAQCGWLAHGRKRRARGRLLQRDLTFDPLRPPPLGIEGVLRRDPQGWR